MQNDLDTMMAAAASPTSSYAADKAHSALQDFLATQPSNTFSDQGSDFADLLAEFTLPGNLLSPEQLGRSPEVTSGSGSGSSGIEYDGEGTAFASGGVRSTSKSPEEQLLDQLGLSSREQGGGFEPAEESTRGTGMGGGGGEAGTKAGQLANAIAGMDSATQSQLLAALLSQPQPSASSTSAPDQYQSQQFAPPSNHPSPYQQPSPAHQPQPPSRHGSPHSFQTFSSGPSANPLQHQSQYQLPVSMAHQAALNVSLPPSLVSSPVASPYLYPSNSSAYYPQPPPSMQQIQQHHQAQALYLQQLQLQSQASPQAFLPGNFQVPFSPHAFVPQQQSGNGQAGPGGDMRMRGGSATGGSYATTADTDDWGENEFMFSPLMSPALTSQSVYSQASSRPPSGSCAPPNHQTMNPSEFFPPLGSPAITPQTFHPADYSNRNSLQGLVDQTQALGFDAATINALQQQGSPHAFYGVNPTRSPRMVATGSGDVGVGTAAGSGRRGAGSKKSRPSPLLKPTSDATLRRKKGTGPARSSSIGSAGVRSATTSPFMGPTHYGAAASSSGTNASGSSARASPTEGADGSGGSINTPSPVDLTMSEIPPTSASHLPELMGPPPPPSASRRISLTSGAIDNATWLNPVTPATFMNFSSDLASAGLTSLDHQPFRQHGSSSHDVTPTDTSAFLPHDASFVDATLLPSRTTTNPLSELAPEPKPRAKKLLAPAPSASAASEPSSAVAKGKGRAGSVSAPATKGGRKGVTKPMSSKALSGPSPKIKPLLGNDVPSDALSRLSAKSNYQNILDGRGADLLGLDPSTLSALSTTQGADNRRTSHKAAEQKRRDSLKQCFEELRRILPPMASNANDEDRRPGEGNVGGQRGGSVDPENPNRGVSKVALLRRSNEYVGTLHDRVDRRDLAIEALRAKLEHLRSQVGEEGGDELEGFDLDALDKDEKKAGTMESYECLDSDDENEYKPKPKRVAASARRKSNADGEAKSKPAGARRSARNANASYDEEGDSAMDVAT